MSISVYAKYVIMFVLVWASYIGALEPWLAIFQWLVHTSNCMFSLFTIPFVPFATVELDAYVPVR